MIDDYSILSTLEAEAFWNMYMAGFMMGLVVWMMPLGFMMALRIAKMGK